MIFKRGNLRKNLFLFYWFCFLAFTNVFAQDAGEESLDRGWIYIIAGNYDQAISDFNKAIQLRPNDALAYYGLGSAYSIKRDYSQARSEFNKAIKLDPNYGDAYNKRAWTYYFQGKYNEAWEDVQKAESLGIIINPKFLAALKNKLSGREK